MCQEIAITAKKKSKDASRIRVGVFSATRNAIRNFVKFYPSQSIPAIKALGRLENQNGYILPAIGKHTPKEYLTSKQEDMQGNETQKVCTLWRSGKLSKKDLLIGVRNAEREEILRKTISNLFRSVALITSQISNPFAVLVIVGSGSSSMRILNY